MLDRLELARRRDRARRRLRQRPGHPADLSSALPDGRVIGVDGSPSMIERRARALAGYGDRVELFVSDLLELELAEPVDAIFSNATFHWILDHERLFARLHAALRPGRRRSRPSAAAGQRRRVEARASRRPRATSASPPTCAGCSDTYNFASVGDTEDRLERAGFEVAAGLAREPLGHAARPATRSCARSALAKHLARLPENLHDDVRRRRPRLDAAAADARVRAPQHLGADGP